MQWIKSIYKNLGRSGKGPIGYYYYKTLEVLWRAGIRTMVSLNSVFNRLCLVRSDMCQEFGLKKGCRGKIAEGLQWLMRFLLSHSWTICKLAKHHKMPNVSKMWNPQKGGTSKLRLTWGRSMQTGLNQEVKQKSTREFRHGIPGRLLIASGPEIGNFSKIH